jgi:hypothetical protein
VKGEKVEKLFLVRELVSQNKKALSLRATKMKK